MAKTTNATNGAQSWGESSTQFLNTVRKQLKGNGVVIGLVTGSKPRLDEVLASGKIAPDSLKNWVSSGYKKDKLFKDALKSGSASGAAAQSGWSGKEVSGRASVAYHVIDDSASGKCKWYIAVTRTSGGAFKDSDLHRLGLLLSQWKSRFNRPRETKMVRLLVGHDDRLIHADPYGEQVLIDKKISLESMMANLRQAVEQRWPDIGDGEIHDMALKLGRSPWWIRFHRQCPIDDNKAEQWYIELRPLGTSELATVCEVEDDRVAQALAYMHDNYNDSPSLTEVSMAVHISPFHFHRLFSKQVGVTPKQYVLQKQMQMARWYLRSRRMAIAQIAIETGFASHGHFTSTFRRFTGQSPTEYRDGAIA